MKTKSLYLLLTLFIVACGQKDSGNSTDGISSSQHRIFITSNSYQGDFGSISQANILCNTAARSAGLELSYKAILSDNVSDAINNILLVGEIYIFDASNIKTLITEAGADLWDNDNVTFINPIDKDEYGQPVFGSVWTGTNGNGYKDVGDDFCSSWISQSSAVFGRFGEIGPTDMSEWINKGSLNCSAYAHLYCISI